MSQNKIKVLHVIKTLSLGGAETNLYNLVQATDTDHFEVHVAYSFGGEIESRFKAGGIKLFKYADGQHKIKSLASVVIILRLAWYILRNNIQIVHTHIFNAHVWGSLSAKLTGRKIVEHVHDFRYMDAKTFSDRRGMGTQFRFARYFKNLSDIVIVLTQETRDFIVKNRYHPAHRIKEIKNGIPLNTFGSSRTYDTKSLRKKFNIPKESFVMLTSARMSAEKNLDIFFQIAPEISKRIPHALFVISGSGPLLEESLEQCMEMGLEKNLRFSGFYPNVDELLAVSDLFILPSFLELHSISILEAMSMKVPVLVSKDVGCHNEFIETWRNGVLLDPHNADEWTEAILRLHNDKDLRLKIGQNGFETCSDQFNIKKISKKIGDVYAELAHS
ncbi:MAG: hypothetical protein A2901_07840 [Elusimicrobia bacterium RIFCSPLOWO2_01_FULL_54_10]|nr:MAG: hypothetical protein A2901_07840 [Elusimicrobia bacterium RIFCSPLOWO2_01_FULL_54_10]